MSTTPRSAREVAQESLRLLLAKDMESYTALWAQDGVFELPFAAPDQPSRILGRAALRAHLAGYTDLLDIHEISDVVLHEGTDRDRVVMEFAASGVVVATRRPYRMNYIAVIATREGFIESYRDYWSPAAAADVLAGVDTSRVAFAPGVGR
ncbi:nuclear transport factor 2 family protein [Kineococcus sp. GCM10028916]|uniref:nuclear transport factor 2 family protein n=1 Tax=Kineococcus sp. GCM10028916 TaxID=3273394 RepID=UPI00363941D6